MNHRIASASTEISSGNKYVMGILKKICKSVVSYLKKINVFLSKPTC